MAMEVNVFDKNRYRIEPIDKKVAMELVVKNHYLHRKAPCLKAFGLIDVETNKIVGCVIYGIPASRSVQIGICGREEADNVIELTRLWVDDSVGRNAESYLVGNTIPMINKEIIISYADASKNHIGYVYQATNWIYTGLSDKHVKWIVEGVNDKHSRHMFDKYGGVERAKRILGDKMIRTERPRKHRYIYFNCSKRRKKELLAKLKYPILPYPKADKAEGTLKEIKSGK